MSAQVTDPGLRETLCSLAARILGDAAEAEDVVQDAFVALHDAERVDHPAAWLRRVTRNAALDRVRRRRPAVDTDTLVATPVVRWSTLGTVDVAGHVPDLVDALPEPYRTAVRRVDLEEVPQSVYAREAGLSPSGARTRVQRGRRLLLTELQRCCPVRFEEGEVVDTGWTSCPTCA